MVLFLEINHPTRDGCIFLVTCIVTSEKYTYITKTFSFKPALPSSAI